ncbi:peptide ABC transporter substrate-binding protein [Clostridium sp. AM34-11AC]|uniref:ABC transporter substrate-binding protein n=1 Tax=Clostridium sp. AM34-11AC TaxID=2305242 RepID=UPI000E4136F6|nr:ABC transporter substrate-binding protein [Clostridium sp. AM34-11AC]RGE03673.1 peptide ABC transporter substrate-binding protein [Clostridium sp. AM34-11AC]
MKKQASIILAALLAVSLTACSGGKTETPATTAAGETSAATEAASTAGGDNTAVSPDNDFVIALQADATHLDPHVSGNGVSNTITNSMYETLVWFDENLELKPLLAKSWTVSDDGLDYTFVLNEGIKFHDGEPFNAESIVANYERAKSDSSLRLASQTAMWDSVTVDSEYQVTIHLKEPNNTFLNKLAQVRIVSPKAIKELGKDGLAKQSAGTGPFILSERVDGGYTKMVRNENYWQDGPKVDTLTWRVVPEDGARVAMLQTGEADIISPLPAIQVDKVKDDASLDVLNLGGLTYRYATLNKNYTLADGRKPLDDVRVRQAMNYAFDSEAYTQVVFQGYASVPTSLFASSVPYYAEQTPYTADVEKAKSLMSEAGYSDGFPINIWVDNTTIEMQGAEFLKQQLAQINIDVNVVPMESTTIADMTSAPEDKTEVQMWYVNWSSGDYSADGSMRNILHGDKYPPSGYNTAFYNNAEFNKCLDDALKTTDTDEITKLYAQAQSIAWEECPWIFLGVDNSLIGQKKYVKGIKYRPGGTILVTNIELVH